MYVYYGGPAACPPAAPSHPDRSSGDWECQGPIGLLLVSSQGSQGD